MHFEIRNPKKTLTDESQRSKWTDII